MRAHFLLFAIACAATPSSFAATHDAPITARLAGAAATPTLIAVVSRKTHGADGQFDLVIDHKKRIDEAVTIEPRQMGVAHTIVFQFNSIISAPGTLAVTDEDGATVSGATAPIANNQEVKVTLPGISDNSRIRVSLSNVNGAGLNVSASLGLLLGDTTNLGAVNTTSISAIKARAGQSVDNTNFRFDVNTSGVISASDIAAVKARNGNIHLGPPWPNYARDARHSALSSIATQPLSRLRWNTPVDMQPQYSGTTLYAHYGSPVITARNTVLIPVKVGAADGFKFEARSGANGALLWSMDSDYILPAHNWLPTYNLTLTTANRVYAAGAGGKLFYRDNPDSATGSVQSVVFYGASAYAAEQSIYDSTVFINTPITADAQGNLFFGFLVTGPNQSNLASGIARVAPDGTATQKYATVLTGTAFAQPVMNSAPALSIDQGTLYVAIRTSPTSPGVQTGYLVALDSKTLALKSQVKLLDPYSGANARVIDDSTSSPAVGPDGDVYFGVLENGPPEHFSQGWMLHFDATLTTTKTPGAFGWDNTASIVPASMVPSYTGTSSYLLMTKYNSYFNGQNRIAILDPNQSQSYLGITVMNEILTILGPTPDPNNPGGVTEWCINTAAVDPITRSVLVNNEDGYLYRWNLVTNQLSERIQLTSGLGEAYTPTAIGPDGAVYAINNGVLFSVGR